MDLDVGNEVTTSCPDACMDMECRITRVELELTEIKGQLADIKETLVNSKSVIDKVAAEVMPTLNALMQSPMLKMLLPKGK